MKRIYSSKTIYDVIKEAKEIIEEFVKDSIDILRDPNTSEEFKKHFFQSKDAQSIMKDNISYKLMKKAWEEKL